MMFVARWMQAAVANHDGEHCACPSEDGQPKRGAGLNHIRNDAGARRSHPDADGECR